jgi:hypothetical protein
VGTIRHLFGPGSGAAYQIPAPRRVRYSEVPVAPRSVFAVFVGWSILVFGGRTYLRHELSLLIRPWTDATRLNKLNN